MLTLDQYRSALTQLSGLALADVRSLLTAVEGKPPQLVRDGLVEYLPGVLEPYMSASGELAASWFEDLRRDAGLPAVYAQSVGGALDLDRLTATVRWAVSPLFDPSSTVTVESLLGGAAQRLVMGGARSTIASNAEADRQASGFARSARPGCCAFCSKGASLGTEYGEARQGKHQYHDLCHCVAVPIFAGTEMAALMDAESESHLERLQQAASLLPPGAPRTEKAMLAAMREEHGIA